MERRDFLVAGAGFALANVTASTAACASNEDERRKHSDASASALAGPAAGGHGAHEGHGAVSPAHTAVADAAAECTRAGRACLQHCLSMLATGDKSMAGCSQSVNVMMPVCEATATLAAAGSEHLAAIAAVCRSVCEECKAECEKHAAKHAECKACLDACTAMLSALDGLA